jgi:uncharacterized protein YeaO (DUF488 family)
MGDDAGAFLCPRIANTIGRCGKEEASGNVVNLINTVNEQVAVWSPRAEAGVPNRSRVGIANGFIGRRLPDATARHAEARRQDMTHTVLTLPRAQTPSRAHDREHTPWDLAARTEPLLLRILPALRDAAVVERLRSRAAGRILTGCVYCRLSPATHGVLIERVPRFTGPHAHYVEWWPGIAPSPLLQEAFAAGRLPWLSFAARYRAELERWPGGLLALWRHLASLLDRHPTVTLLGVAPAPGGDERQAACARRVLRAWLLGDEEASRVAAA